MENTIDDPETTAHQPTPTQPMPIVVRGTTFYPTRPPLQYAGPLTYSQGPPPPYGTAFFSQGPQGPHDTDFFRPGPPPPWATPFYPAGYPHSRGTIFQPPLRPSDRKICFFHYHGSNCNRGISCYYSHDLNNPRQEVEIPSFPHHYCGRPLCPTRRVPRLPRLSTPQNTETRGQSSDRNVLQRLPPRLSNPQNTETNGQSSDRGRLQRPEVWQTPTQNIEERIDGSAHTTLSPGKTQPGTIVDSGTHGSPERHQITTPPPGAFAERALATEQGSEDTPITTSLPWGGQCRTPGSQDLHDSTCNEVNSPDTHDNGLWEPPANSNKVVDWLWRQS